MKIKIKTVIIVGFLFPIIIILCGFLIIACLELGPIVDRPFKPEVKHGEFPFKLTYDINGKRIVVDDVIICDYDGLTTYGGRTSIKWNSTLKSNNDQIVLLDLKDANSQTAKGEKILRLIFDVGTANYYMDDSSRPQSPAQGLEKVFLSKLILMVMSKLIL